MITETITYTNFNGEPDSRTINFHISEAVLMDNMTMRDRLEHLVSILSGEVRQLSMADIQEIVNIVKWFMAISYGVKSIDGSSFDQDDPAGSGPVWRAFQATPAYSAFLMSLFREPEKSVQFIINVLPAELREEAKAEAEKNPQMKALIQGADKAARPAPGTRIVDDYTLASNAAEPASAPTDEDDDPDYEAMLLSMPTEAPAEVEVEKRPITQQQYDFMKNQLSASPEKFDHFMSTRVLVEG